MVKTTMFPGPSGGIAVHESAGGGGPLVFIHGNSSSARAFSRQLEGPLGARWRILAIDLPGHGQSEDARDPGAYLLPGQARTVIAVAEGLGIADALFVGWSRGGHILLEAAPELGRARGFAIFGTPPLAFPPAMGQAFLPHPALALGFQAELTREEAGAYVAAFFKAGYADIPTFFLEDALRTDGRSRAPVGAHVAPGGYRDEVKVVAELRVPLAVLHGADEQLVNGGYFASVPMPTLWRGVVQTIAGAGHAPQWERAADFDALIEAFARDCETRA
jgi:pimeloyl-ACP methyl ester carboxylesterase